MQKHYVLPAIISFIFTISFFAPLTAQEIIWAKKYGGTAQEKIYSLTHNSSGELLITGTHSGNTTMGSQNVPCGAFPCFYLLNLDSSGLVKSFKTNDRALGRDVAVDNNDNIIVTGHFLSNTNFSGQNLITRGQTDAFLASYDKNGTLKWVKSAGGDKNDFGYKVAVNNDGDIIAMGQFWQKIFFTPNDSLTSNTTYPFYIAKFSGSDGSLQWARTLHNTGSMEINDIKIEPTGQIWITGAVVRSMNYEGTTLTPSGQGDVLVMKLKSTGEPIWMKLAGSNANLTEAGKGLALDGSGNAYVTGKFYGTASFGNHTITSYGHQDIFVAKYDSSGNVKWVKRYGGGNGEEPAGIALDNEKNIYITGLHGDFSQIGDTVLRSTSLAADVLIVKMDSVGKVLWVFSGGASGTDNGKNILVVNNKHLYVTGEFGITIGDTSSATANFGPYTITTPNGYGDVFLLKFSIEDDNTGIKDFFNSPKPFTVYPNPVQAGSPYLTIDLPLQENSRLSVYSTTGKLMHTAQLNRNDTRTTVQLPGLTPGMYFLRLNSNKQVYHSKILVE